MSFKIQSCLVFGMYFKYIVTKTKWRYALLISDVSCKSLTLCCTGRLSDAELSEPGSLLPE